MLISDLNVPISNLDVPRSNLYGEDRLLMSW